MKNGILQIEARSKVNLHLKVLNKRDDGFHNLESIFALLDFGDSLELELLPDFEGKTLLEMEFSGPCAARPGDLPLLPPEKNLAYRAAALFREESGFARDIAIRLVKRVPPASGLGGGASDAAAILFALNFITNDLAEKGKIACKALSPGSLFSLAARLGSDLPFFLSGSAAAAVSGRGEEIRPLAAPGYPKDSLGLVLVFPPFSVSTAAAFGLIDKARESQRRETGFNGNESTGGGFGRAGVFLQGDPSLWLFENEFLSLFYDRYRPPLDALKKAGALWAGLSGSGSACFGVFPSREAALAAPVELPKEEYILQRTFFSCFPALQGIK